MVVVGIWLGCAHCADCEQQTSGQPYRVFRGSDWPSLWPLLALSRSVTNMGSWVQLTSKAGPHTKNLSTIPSSLSRLHPPTIAVITTSREHGAYEESVHSTTYMQHVGTMDRGRPVTALCRVERCEQRTSLIRLMRFHGSPWLTIAVWDARPA